MKRVIIGAHTDDNFGLLSLISGADNLIKHFDSDPEISFFDYFPLNDNSLGYLDKSNIKYISEKYNKRALVDAFLCRIGIRKKPHTELVKTISEADCIFDVYGIYFFNRFKKTNQSLFRTIKNLFYSFGACVIGRVLGKKVIKTPASYGPITQKADITTARITSKYIFNAMYAREQESLQELKRVSPKKELSYCPDLANLIPFKVTDNTIPTVGFAVSSQIIKSWNKDEPYIDCMVNLIRHIQNNYGCRIVLIPNEIHKGNPYNDFHVANEIKSCFPESDNVILFDSQNEDFFAQRDLIASCDAIVSGRYHSCVASLSASVPTLVTGWHYKYRELMELYDQTEYIVHDDVCSSDLLAEKFDEIWANKYTIKNNLSTKAENVKKLIYQSFSGIFN